ncbi:Protein of unknown function [Bacillus wiedmannii]|nr:Protein of unknown function [Bacillus wiedmannii]
MNILSKDMKHEEIK